MPAARMPRIRGAKDALHMLDLLGRGRARHAQYNGRFVPRAQRVVLRPVLALAEKRQALDVMLEEGIKLGVPKGNMRSFLNGLRGKKLTKNEIAQASKAQHILAQAEARDQYLDRRIMRVFGEGTRIKTALVERYEGARQALRGLHGKIPNNEYNFRLDLLRQALEKLRRINF